MLLMDFDDLAATLIGQQEKQLAGGEPEKDSWKSSLKYGYSLKSKDYHNEDANNDYNDQANEAETRKVSEKQIDPTTGLDDDGILIRTQSAFASFESSLGSEGPCVRAHCPLRHDPPRS